MEAFKSKDPEGTGYISALDFQEIMVSVKRHLLTEDVKDNLVAVSIPFAIRSYSTINQLRRIPAQSAPLLSPDYRRAQSELRLLHGIQFIAEQYGADQARVPERDRRQSLGGHHEGRAAAVIATHEPNHAAGNRHSLSVDMCSASAWVSRQPAGIKHVQAAGSDESSVLSCRARAAQRSSVGAAHAADAWSPTRGLRHQNYALVSCPALIQLRSYALLLLKCKYESRKRS